MVFRMPPGAGPRQIGLETQVDYRLLRASTVAQYRSGAVDRSDVCDAHPELIRAAANVGKERAGPCPICEQHRLVEVVYVFGPRLPRHGRCVSLASELARLARRAGTHIAYTVEACTSCNWNHLLKRSILKGT